MGGKNARRTNPTGVGLCEFKISRERGAKRIFFWSEMGGNRLRKSQNNQFRERREEMKKTVLAVLVAAICIAFSATAYAATTTGTFGVQVTAVDGCWVYTGEGGGYLAFPDYDGGSMVEGTGTLEVKCPDTMPYEIWLDAGQNIGGPSYRRMSNGTGAFLNYFLLQSPTGPGWGDDSPNNPAPTTPAYPIKSDTGTGSIQVHTVYGLIDPYQAVPAGLFNDIVTVTIYY